MTKYSFTEEEIKALRKERYEHPCPRVQKRMDAVYLISQGLTALEIARLLETSRQTISSWLSWYRKEGIHGLKKKRHLGLPNVLKSHGDSIEKEFIENPPRTLKEASEKIKEMTGVERSPRTVGRFLNSLGMRRRKTGSVPKKANPEAQEEFKKKLSIHSWRKRRRVQGRSFS